jgi:hypothetical protein
METLSDSLHILIGLNSVEILELEGECLNKN